MVKDPFSPRDSYCLLIGLIFCPKNMAWQPSGWGGPRNAWTEIRVMLYLWLESHHLAARGGNCLSLGEGISGHDYGSWVGISLVFSLVKSLGSVGLFRTPSNIYSPSQLKPDKIFERV